MHRHPLGILCQVVHPTAFALASFCVAGCAGTGARPAGPAAAAATQPAATEPQAPAPPPPVATTQPGAGGDDAALRALMERIAEAARGDFRLAGEVVDDAGQPLADVRVNVRLSEPGLNGAERSERHRVDGRFDFRHRGYAGASYDFYKRGYYGAQVVQSTDTRLTDEQFFQLVHGGVLAPAEVAGEVRIILEKRGEPAKLHRFGGLRTFAGTRGLLADLDGTPMGPKEWYRNDERRPCDLAPDAPVPPAGVLVTMTTDDDGRPVMREVRMVRSPALTVPADLRLRMGGDGGGFVPFRPSHPMRAGVEMRRAPEHGYARELAFTDDDYRVLYGTGVRSCYFFFRTPDGRYGRGRVGPCHRDRDDDRRLVLGIDLLVQPDHTRNLETGTQWMPRKAE